ncbi:hypothetical protein [Flavobacterium sp. ZT3R18]|uniref:hypothetical protein n=1 Tax=Flavobacterium sp. ZT3R18 TaxID=2594429 RepID=UPI00163DB8F9|nr:hypothetical protein [Flavobacterium sp. ZT3R18]
MLKRILKLEGAQKLTKNEQKQIDGGLLIRKCPWGTYDCEGDGRFCIKSGQYCP